jgi:hypothetical protein
MARHSTPSKARNHWLKRQKNGDIATSRQRLAGQPGKGMANTGHLPQETRASD